jgi:hypothetical protein
VTSLRTVLSAPGVTPRYRPRALRFLSEPAVPAVAASALGDDAVTMPSRCGDDEVTTA